MLKVKEAHPDCNDWVRDATNIVKEGIGCKVTFFITIIIENN